MLTENEIMVLPLEALKLGLSLKKILPEFKDRNDIIVVVPSDAIILCPEQDGFLLINADCCYQESETAFFNSRIQEIFRVGCKIKSFEKIGNVTHVEPVLSFTYITGSVGLVNIYTQKAVTLKEYMGSRYNYNPRIIKNMKELLKLLNELKS